MDMSGSEFAPHIRIILRKDRHWRYVSKRGCECFDGPYCRIRRLAVTRLTRYALQLMYPAAGISVRHGRGRHAKWLWIDLTIPPRTCDLSAVRGNVNDLLTGLGIRYATYDHPPFGKRLCIRMRINNVGRFRRL